MKLYQILYKYFYKIITFLFFPVAFFLVIIIRLISPILLIRWNCTVSTRIGHYVENINVYLCEKELNLHKAKRKTIDIFYDRPVVCNKQLSRMWRRKVFFLPWFIMHPINSINEYFFDKIYNSNRKHELGYYRNLNNLEKYLVPPLSSFDSLNVQDKAKIQLHFTNEEKISAQKILKKIGIDGKSKVISLIIRDSSYLKRHYKNINWQQHALRNTNFKYFQKSAEFLAKKNFKVIVYGDISQEQKNKVKNNKNIFFYSDLEISSPFMDIYLLSKSYFVISSTTGFDSVPFAFKIPIIEVGVVPFNLQRTFSNLYITLFKIYFSKTLNRSLTMSEIFDNDIHNIDGNDMIINEIDFIHPSEDDILEACIEMIDKINNKIDQSPENLEMQKIFKKKYTYYINKYYPERSVLENKGTVAKNFLKRNKFLIDSDIKINK